MNPRPDAGPSRQPCHLRCPSADPVDPHHSRASTDALLVAAGRGDLDAFAALYDRTAPVVFGMASTLLGSAGPAEHAVTQVYERLWHTAPGFDPAGRSAYATVLFLTRRRLTSDVHARWSRSRVER